MTAQEAPRHVVRSQGTGQQIAKQGGLVPRWASFAAGLVALLFGVPLWITGAWYTLIGWVALLNMGARMLRFRGQIDLPAGGAALVGLIAIGVMYSIVEVHLFPVRRQGKQVVTLPALMWLIYLLIIGTDLATTGLGVLNPTPETPPLLMYLAASVQVAAIGTVVLTFLPEGLILGGLKLLRG
jgi:hypothetical protein